MHFKYILSIHHIIMQHFYLYYVILFDKSKYSLKSISLKKFQKISVNKNICIQSYMKIFFISKKYFH